MSGPGRHLLIVAGDPSGDEHAAALVSALRRKDSSLRVTAMGGAHLRQAADRFIYPLVGIGGFGFWEPVTKLPQLWKAWRVYKRTLANEKPDLVIPVDYYGFNIHVARAAKRAGIPVAYYISPQVWASRPRRVQELAKAVSKMLVIFPFEADLYRKAGVPVAWVGHPLLERLPAPEPPGNSLLLGLLPGSRRGSVIRHLPIQIGAAELLRKKFPALRCQVFRPRELDESLYRSALGDRSWIELVYDSNYELRKKLSVAITVSGTASLENALLGIPMVIMYRLSAVTYQIAKRVIRIPFVGIPNILAGHAIVPEFLQDAATPERLAAAAGELLGNADFHSRMRNALLTLRSTFEQGGAPRAAEEIALMLKQARQTEAVA